MIWVLVAVIVVLAIAVAVLASRQQRSRRLKQGFGPEYDRVVAERGSQRTAERELVQRRQRHDRFEIRELEPAARARYRERWADTQRDFVDHPIEAVDRADVLVREVMHDRGYPVEDDFEQRAADISVDHPQLVDNYRAAHGISVRARSGQAGTEDLRQSMVHFRALFKELLAPVNDDNGSQAVAEDRGALSDQTTTRSG